MQNRHDTILRSINTNAVGCNILTSPTHEAYQTNLENLPYKFYMVQKSNVTKPWTFSSRPVPKNHILIDWDQLPQENIHFDIVLSQNKFGQAQLLKQFADTWNAPWINVEHTWPHPSWSKDYLTQLKNKLSADVNVFISEASCVAWLHDPNSENTLILRHGVNTDVFRNVGQHNDGKILTVANGYIERAWCLGYDIYKRITESLPTNPVGDTPGLSSATKNVDELVQIYGNASVFLNTSTYSPIPMSLLEAAACCCPIVSTATCAITELIEDGINGFCSNDEEYLREKLEWCLNNPEDAKLMGKKARQTVLEKFSLDSHVEQWNKLIKETYGKFHNQWC